MIAQAKTVLVTGAAKRLGRALVLDLARHGWTIALHYHSSEKEARATAADAQTNGVKVALLKADLSREDETATLIGRASTEIGPLAALVNSASLFENDDWYSVTRASWDAHMETNLRAPFVLSQAFARQVPRDGQGAIVNIIDQRVLKPTPQFLSYSLSKAGLKWLTITLAQALAPRVRVNAVGPGPTIINARQSQADFTRQREATVLGRGAEPQDVCDAVRYLLEAGAVTGQMIAVDGGQHLIWQTPDVVVKE
ncbi:MAG: SDR family oxidoreductase [Alphaproteobacteria bacterium]|nr:SDR family oxidoreductase [Alphaproteobacteria bacterium]MDE2110053.1 SDR family oxidoreductase [Alphaproteobacteria bacterium]MDE2492984.1 SDR family oxidoreductase [Alphaproteobacteria bacterium]